MNLLFPQGIQEYVHLVCNSFFANVSLVIQTFHDLFIKRHKSRSVKDARF